MALTQESVLSFLLERGGKVKNSELLNNFRSQISCSDPAEKQHNRDLFKKLVNSVAVVKQVDEVKFVVVKKRYQDFVRDDASPRARTDDGFSGRRTSFSYASPRRAESARTICPDTDNNNACCNTNVNDKCHRDAKHASVRDRGPLSRSVSGADAAAVKVLNVSGDQARKSGAVFAVIAVKTPPREPAQGGSRPQAHRHKTTDEPVAKVSVPTLNSNSTSYRKDAQRDSQCWENKQAEDMHPPGFPQVRPQSKTPRQGDDAKYSEPVPLEPLAHEWLVKCAAGLWGQIYGLLLKDTRLAHKRDFMSGFTALHWAAKEGNSEMIHKLMDVSRKRGTCVNVNSKAHGGYTPLHVAAIHGHAEAMVLLVQGYGADVSERDNDGKRAFHYLGKGVPAEVRALLGGPQQSKCREKTEDEECREPPKGFNSISKLFQPHVGKKQKTTAKFAHDW